MRIALEVLREVDLGASRRHRRIFLYRLWARVRFQQTRGWSEAHPAILDTGAPYSLVPASLWPRLHLEPLAQLPLRGIVPGEAAELEATLAKVSGRLLDARHVSPRLTLRAMLVKTDHVPLILGWSGCLDRARLVVDTPRHRAWLEF